MLNNLEKALKSLNQRLDNIDRINRRWKQRNSVLQENLKMAIYQHRYYMSRRGKTMKLYAKNAIQFNELKALKHRLKSLLRFRLNASDGKGRIIPRLSPGEYTKFNYILGLDFRALFSGKNNGRE